MPQVLALHEGSRVGRLDGVRCLAISLVFAMHAGFSSLGWTGVSLFFVLSGMFITGILRRSRTNHSYWKPFYVKRITRICPPLLIAFVGAAIFCTVPWKRVGLYDVFFLANVAEAMYRGQNGTLSVLWSLAVEEQFYFLWPFAVRFLDRTQLIRVLVCILIAEPILRGAVTPMLTTFWPIYFLTPFQLDGLATGSLMALLLEDNRSTKLISIWSGKLFTASLCLFAALSFFSSFHRESNSILFNSLGYSLVNLAASGLIAFVLLKKDALPSRLLGHPIAVFLGSISYGLYLFHPIGLALFYSPDIARHFVHGKAALVASLAILFSWLSFKCFEQPIIKWGKQKASSHQEAGMPAQLLDTTALP